MSDFTYRCAKWFFTPPIWGSSRPLVLHADRAKVSGGCILAASHLSPFDIPALIRHTPRPIDFLGRAEFQKSRAVKLFFSLFNTFYVDRASVDTSAALAAVRRLQAGRLVGMFPEGALRSPAESVLSGGPIKPGIARLAQLADVPVIPCAVLGTSQYSRAINWLPLWRVRYGVIFGQPVRVNKNTGEPVARETFLQELTLAFCGIGDELMRELKWEKLDR